jgi:hypothetical protein
MKSPALDGKPIQDGELRPEESRFARQFAQKDENQQLDDATSACRNDPDLARLCSAWSALPGHIKAAIMALVTAGCSTGWPAVAKARDRE